MVFAAGQFVGSMPIRHRRPDTLFAAEVPLHGLVRNVSEETLHLFKLLSSRMAQPRDRPTKVVRGELLNARFVRILADHMANGLFR